MEAVQKFFTYDWTKLIVPLVVLAVVLVAGYIAKRLLFRALRRWAARTQTRADDIFIHAFSGPFMIWVLMLGIFLATQSSELQRSTTTKVSNTVLILWIGSITLVVSRLASDLIKLYGRGKQGQLPVTSLSQNLARIIIFTLGFLIVLNQLGVSIAPILTALGVGGLAVALALQDTLSNLFAGFYVSVSGHIRVGDYIKLDSGGEGYVADITWRSTTVRTGANNLIIVPNAKLAQAIVTNYHLPDKAMTTKLPVSVSYDSDPDEVLRILTEEAKNLARERPDLLTALPPVARLSPGFGDSAIDFTLTFQVPDFEQQVPAQDELRQRLLKRFRAAGIEIPFPQRVLHVRPQPPLPA